MSSRLISLFTASSVVLVALPALAEDIVIGISAPITGPVAAYGEQMNKAARAYSKWINERGGILGRNMSVVIEDDECNPKAAVSVANRFAANNISFIVGPLCSPAVSAARDTYRENGILSIMLAQGKVSSPDYPDLLRINASNYGIAKGMIESALTAAYQKISLLYVNDAYGNDLKEKLETLAREKGVDLGAHSYEAQANDFSALIHRMKSEHTEAVMVAGNVPEVLHFVRQLKEVHSEMPVIFSGTGTNPDLASAYRCEGTELTYITVVAAEDGKNIKVDQRLLDKFAQENMHFQESAYFTVSALEAWRAAVEKTQSFDNAAVRQVLLAGGLQTMTGEARFVATGPNYGHPAHEPIANFAWRCDGPGVMKFGR